METSSKNQIVSTGLQLFGKQIIAQLLMDVQSGTTVRKDWERHSNQVTQGSTCSTANRLSVTGFEVYRGMWDDLES